MLPDYLHDLSTYLQTNNIGTFGTDIFLYGFQKGVFNCIALVPSPGYRAITTVTGDMTIHRPELDIQIRNRSGKLAEQKARAIYNLLNMITNTTIGSTNFKRIEASNPPFEISKTEQEGTIFAVNFDLQIT